MTNLVAKRLSRFNCGQRKFFLLLSIVEGQNGLRLTLSDGGKAWSGKLNEQDFGEWSERTKLSPSDYRSQTMKALSGESFNGRKFEYDVQEEGGNGSVVLTWKRILDDEDIKLQLGSVNLRPELDLAKSTSHILESSIQLTNQLQDNIQQLTDERDRLTSEHAVALKRLEKFVSIKEDTEKDLFSKFVVVINDKKAKIRELKRKLEQRTPQETISTARSPSGPEKSRKCHAVSSAEESDGESPSTSAQAKVTDSEAEYDTDDEMKKSSHSAKNIRREDERSGTSNGGRADDEESDGLILDDADDDDDDCLAAVVPKRPRKTKAETVARKSTSKTRIPVTDPQPSSVRRSASLRKTASKGSSHNLDVSNLINDMD